MKQNAFARPRWRAFAVGACVMAGLCASASFFATPARAQFRGSWDANAAVSRFDAPKAPIGSTPSPAPIDPRWLDQRAMGGSLRFSHPFLQLNADAVVRDGDVRSHATGGMSGLFATPAWKNFRVSLSVDARHTPVDGLTEEGRDSTWLGLRAPSRKPVEWQALSSTSISYARGSTGIWLSARNQRGALTSDSVSNWSVLSGITRAFGDFFVGVSLGARNANNRTFAKWGQYLDTVETYEPRGNRVDTTKIPVWIGGDSGFVGGWRHWSEGGATLAWARGRFAVDGSVNARPQLGRYQSAVWGDLSAVAAITSRVALIASTRTTPRTPGIEFSAQRTASIGLRFAPPALFRPSPATPIRMVSRAFRVLPSGGGQYTFTLTIPNARSVEVAGDFTSWEGVELRQVTATRWEIQMRVEPGSHRCNIRIDGAEWVPPPGMPSVTDEFNGRVGLFVVE